MFVTGHSGFTGGWVFRWLGEIGSIVAGFSLAPITEPSLFNYDGFSDILVINRSVREPLEEYIFSATYEGHTGPQAPGIGSLRRRYTQIELNACGPAKASLFATADLVAVGE